MYTSCLYENQIVLHSETKFMDWHSRHFSSISGNIIMCITLFEFCFIVISCKIRISHLDHRSSIILECHVHSKLWSTALAEVNTFSVICGEVKGFICKEVISFNYSENSLHWFFHQCNYFWMSSQMSDYKRIIEHFSKLHLRFIPEG